MNTYSRLWKELRALYAARHEPESIRPLAEIYWRLMLSFSMLLIVLSLGWGVWVFVDVITTLTSSPSSSGTPPVALDRKQLDATLQVFGAKSARQQAIMASSTSIGDPSK